MKDHALAALFVIAVWWLSTGIVLKLVWLPRRTFRLSVAASTLGCLAGLALLAWTRNVEAPWAAYLAFGSAIAVWGWHELVFLLGWVTGPRKIACPPEAAGWQRFRYATATVIHHEIALAITMVAVWALTHGGTNQVGTSTFMVLWIMRLSAKLNVFLGVRNLTEQFVPQHLRYLLSYFRRARLNWLMPLSLVLGTTVAIRLVAQAISPEATAFTLVGRTLVATILTLAVVEHVFLSVPLPDAMLWKWALRSRRVKGEAPTNEAPAEAR